ncbi:group II intron maturase-specific domain-containing protein [Saccharopolyspora hattusasensis]|uniref:group II intron maturase-specific domain-containing protein n=1 Tax=Saccharopolyspora hattusasensis TaxID=1128679 RepID=UPI003D953FBB
MKGNQPALLAAITTVLPPAKPGSEHHVEIDRSNGKIVRRAIWVAPADMLNPVIRGWGMYYRRANVRRLFNRLNMWIVRRIWGWRFKRWRNAGWRTLPETRLYGEYGLVNLLQLIPSMRDYYRQKGYIH